MKILPIIVSAILATVLTDGAFACGDSLYRVGKGISYREYAAPLPGNVLIYGGSESARKLADALAIAGHKVHVAQNEFELGVELGNHDYDVIIAPYRDHEVVEAEYTPSETTFLPVAADKVEARTAEHAYSTVMRADRDDVKHYLKAIHRVLRTKTA